MELNKKEIQEIVECIKIAKQYGEKDFDSYTTELLAKLEANIK